MKPTCKDTAATTPVGATRDTNTPISKGLEAASRKKSLSMHEDIPVWYDCCSCEIEPYWEEAIAEQLQWNGQANPLPED